MPDLLLISTIALGGIREAQSSMAILSTVETNSNNPPGAGAHVEMFEIDHGPYSWTTPLLILSSSPINPRQGASPLQQLPAPCHESIDKADYGYEK